MEYVSYLLNKYELSPDFIQALREMKQFLVMEKKAPVEFVKDGSIVVCTSEYECLKLTYDKVKHYYEKAKLFIEEGNTIFAKHERANGRTF